MKKVFYAFIGGTFFGGVGMYAFIRHRYMLLKRFRFNWKKLNLNPQEKWEFPED